nr:hypothetical protein B0A51_10338 [Rachicladosporium sp. CCFEE 5018]
MSTKSDAGSTSKIVTEAEQKIEYTLNVLWDGLPAWQQDNHYIHSGYRPQSNSYRKSAASLGHVHNETVNIYTHLVGAVLAAVAAGVLHIILRPRYAQATQADVLVFSCYFLGAVTCLGMSATYHTISNHSQAVSKFGNQLDYMGIVFLIWGSFVPSIYYGFSAEPELVKVYWTMITSIGAATLVVIMYPKLSTPAWRPVRAAMFVFMGISAVVPVIHGIKLYGAAQMNRQIGLSWLVAQGVLYISGAAIYAARIPERWQPGRFDIVGSSHQIFHVLVVLAAAAHLVGLLKAFDYEHSFRLSALSAYANAKKFGGP